MSASASPLTGKNRRRILRALGGRRTRHGQRLAERGDRLRYLRGANFPNGTQEIFGVGLDGAVWTDWGTEARPSGWKSLGAPSGECVHSGRLNIANYANYSLTMGCYDNSGELWERDRSAGVNGGWGTWY
jgi:hypothetical protein